MNSPTRLFPAIGAAVLLVSCSGGDRISGPSLVESDVYSPAVAAVTCSANISSGNLICGGVGSTGSDATGIDNRVFRPVILGGQNQYVTLASANIEVYADTFAFDVTIENLLGQPLGTVDGTAADPTGIRVFFASGPSSTASGAIAVANPDGVGTFTATNQPYFEYPGLLAPAAISEAKRWKLRFDPEVENFVFTVYVYAEVAYPNGYVDEVPYVLTLNLGEERMLAGVARNAVGKAVGEGVIWDTDDPGVAAIFGSTVTAGSKPGITTVKAFSGARPVVHTTAVSVCPAVTVTSGSTYFGDIESSDCFSSFGGPDGRPTTSYYGDLYRVTLTAGETLTVTLDPDGDLDTHLTLASHRTGRVVARNDDDETGELGLGSRIVYTATETGTYVIEASTFSAEATGPYILGVMITSAM